MIQRNIPGWGTLRIENIILDLNGTLALDGKILSQARKKVQSLAKEVRIYILTADTQGTAGEETGGMNVEWVKVSQKEGAKDKLRFLKSLNPKRTVAIGNGNNDSFMLQEASLGIAVMGGEGLSIAAMKNADLVVKNVADALDLFLRPKRLTATLRG